MTDSRPNAGKLSSGERREVKKKSKSKKKIEKKGEIEKNKKKKNLFTIPRPFSLEPRLILVVIGKYLF